MPKVILSDLFLYIYIPYIYIISLNVLFFIYIHKFIYKKIYIKE
nr:MAG TPA: hypothetical protein [Caudoviricetes sp.]